MTTNENKLSRFVVPCNRRTHARQLFSEQIDPPWESPKEAAPDTRRPEPRFSTVLTVPEKALPTESLFWFVTGGGSSPHLIDDPSLVPLAGLRYVPLRVARFSSLLCAVQVR